MSSLYNWWLCRARIRQLESELKRAGVHQRDPMYGLIREMAMIPDRLFRLVLLLVMTGVMGFVLWWLWGQKDTEILDLSVLPGSSSRSRIIIFNAPGGSRWIPCGQAHEMQCLEVFTQPLTQGKS